MPTSSSALNAISALLEERTGQQLAANRAWRIETALKPLMRERGLHSLDDLIAAMVVARTGELADMVVDALLNQETSFFRDAAVLDLLADAVTDMRAEQPHRRLRIWSAGCSNGQEPLSLAMLLLERAGGANATIPEIVATDISASALARAKAARYSQFEIQRGLSVRRMISWFEGTNGDWTANSDLVNRIQFRQQNLASDAPPPGKFDVVLCRNVMLYFTLDVRRQVFERLFEALRPGGLLVLGAGETVIGQTDRFVPSDRYRGFYHSIDEFAPKVVRVAG
ncbi:MAG: protein-glutamate O-methyltransferase CheR [Sphingomonas sp.]|nr:protein-glutamate O-methyltransferase CheR [Sphingomonas sp.]